MFDLFQLVRDRSRTNFSIAQGLHSGAFCGAANFMAEMIVIGWKTSPGVFELRDLGFKRLKFCNQRGVLLIEFGDSCGVSCV
ncbi:hypothetical protein D3C84_967350 [compost metagenome]